MFRIELETNSVDEFTGNSMWESKLALWVYAVLVLMHFIKNSKIKKIKKFINSKIFFYIYVSYTNYVLQK